MNFYETLGVAKDASPEAIKTAYRRLARKHHPDSDGGDKEVFQTIEQAYRILKDPATRKEYDDTGSYHQGPSIEDMARVSLYELIESLLKQRNYADGDYVRMAKKETNAKLIEVQQSIGELQGKISKVKKMIGRFEGIDMDAHFDCQIKSMDAQIVSSQLHEKVIIKAIELLSGCRYTGECSDDIKTRTRMKNDSLLGMFGNGTVFP